MRGERQGLERNGGVEGIQDLLPAVAGCLHEKIQPARKGLLVPGALGSVEVLDGMAKAAAEVGRIQGGGAEEGGVAFSRVPGSEMVEDEGFRDDVGLDRGDGAVFRRCHGG